MASMQQGMPSRVGYTDLLDLPEDGRRYEIHQGDRLDRVKSFGEGPWQVS